MWPRLADLQELGFFLGDARVSRREMVEVSRDKHFLFVVGICDAEAALDYVAPVLARAAVVGESLEQRVRNPPRRERRPPPPALRPSRRRELD